MLNSVFLANYFRGEWSPTGKHVVRCEASNERPQNVITSASYWEGTTGSFYFRLPSGKESTHLPVIKTKPPYSYGGLLLEKQKTMWWSLHCRKSAGGDMCAGCGGKLFALYCKLLSVSGKTVLVIGWQFIQGAWWTTELVTSAVVSSENDCDQTCLNKWLKSGFFSFFHTSPGIKF